MHIPIWHGSIIRFKNLSSRIRENVGDNKCARHEKHVLYLNLLNSIRFNCIIWIKMVFPSFVGYLCHVFLQITLRPLCLDSEYCVNLQFFIKNITSPYSSYRQWYPKITENRRKTSALVTRQLIAATKHFIITGSRCDEATRNNIWISSGWGMFV